MQEHLLPSDFSLSSYDYTLPQELIAMHPTSPRRDGKLLVYYRNSGEIRHCHFRDFSEIVPRDYTLVCNDTKVLRARLYGYKQGGENIREILFHKAYSVDSTPSFLVQIRGRVKRGTEFRICDRNHCPTNFSMRVLEVLDNGLRVVSFYDDTRNAPLHLTDLYAMLEAFGHIPLPPYMKRQDTLQDSIDYQSAFAKNEGAVAAPTASLHFSDEDFSYLKTLYDVCYITLHVGAGTFANVEAQDIRAHIMHTESYAITPKAREKILGDSKLLCIGTTAARAVEYFWRVRETEGLCDLFLHPGNTPKRVDALLTNFHFPKSTLLMLVSAFVSCEEMIRIYTCAIAHKYKFFSYGDGMLIL